MANHMMSLFILEANGIRWSRPEPILTTSSFGIIHLVQEILEDHGCVCEVDFILDLNDDGKYKLRQQKQGIANVIIGREELFRFFGENTVTNSVIMNHFNDLCLIKSENNSLKQRNQYLQGKIEELETLSRLNFRNSYSLKETAKKNKK